MWLGVENSIWSMVRQPIGARNVNIPGMVRAIAPFTRLRLVRNSRQMDVEILAHEMLQAWQMSIQHDKIDKIDRQQ